MSKVLEIYKGTGYNKNVSLAKYQYSDGSTHWFFRDRLGHSGNPTDQEATKIISDWHLVKEVR